VSSQIAIYPGSFDPPTFGHYDVVERASKLFPRIIVALGLHPKREPLFSMDERMDLLQRVFAPFTNVEVDVFSGLLVEYARGINARVIVRGLRAQTDFEYELQIAHANADLAPEIDTVFLPTRTRHGFISASLVREISRHGGDVSRYAPEEVCSALRAKYESLRRAGRKS
jgi:pantetheine-phosphate adenylyltransferase